jgi:hypothetical protein
MTPTQRPTDVPASAARRWARRGPWLLIPAAALAAAVMLSAVWPLGPGKRIGEIERSEAGLPSLAPAPAPAGVSAYREVAPGGTAAPAPGPPESSTP